MCSLNNIYYMIFVKDLVQRDTESMKMKRGIHLPVSKW